MTQPTGWAFAFSLRRSQEKWCKDLNADVFRPGILGTGSFAPEKILSNHDLAKMVETDDEWITTRTGISERRMAGPDEATSDLAIEAAKKALDDAKTRPEEIDLIIVATVTPDMFFPATACLVQDALGANSAGAFDLSAACSGFVCGLSTAASMITAGAIGKALVIGAETLTKITNYEDRTSCILFGDGAGAAVLGPSDRRRIVYSKMGSDGSGGDMMKLPAGGSRTPTTIETVQDKLHYMVIRGREVFKFAVIKMQDCIQDALDANGYHADDISLIVPHQVNLRILKAAADKFGLPMEKLQVNIERYGNTAAASLPMALDEAIKTRDLKEGDVVILVAFGGGLTWASALIEW
ncbi:MAG: ketoacyl-ACP synthase III [Planctomycetes bacterium]|nr:ketoacyl-ACP synthase III [Planctomycetota bacterium]